MRSTFLPEARTRHAIGDFDGDAQAELMVDFASLGLWVCDNGAWTQVSGVNPD
jgi:hypothetical protein